MLYWTDLKKYDMSQPQESFSRTSEVAKKYNDHKHRLKSKGITIEQHIKQTILNDAAHALVDNEFRYNIDDAISHKLFWSTQSVSMSEARKLAIDYYNPRDIIILENPLHMRSVPGLLHYHIFLIA
jgi:hypothetical protein